MVEIIVKEVENISTRPRGVEVISTPLLANPRHTVTCELKPIKKGHGIEKESRTGRVDENMHLRKI